MTTRASGDRGIHIWTGTIAVPGVELLRELGRGAHTVVYLARRGDTRYAVKVLTERGDERAAADFRREAAMLACVAHPGLVQVHEVGEAAGHPYLIMDLVDGRSLAEVLLDGRLDPPAVLDLALALADALRPAHRAGLVHRDIKPDNIMISDGRPQLIDFGLAGRSGAEAGDVAVGTFAYSAPEQTGVLHRAIDSRSDLYALGVVLYECLAGVPPFVADDVGELVHLHLSATPVPLREARPSVSPALAAVVAKLLAKDPDDRYQSADGLEADLIRIASAEQAGKSTGESTGTATGESDGAVAAFPLGAGDRAVHAADLELVGRRAERTALFRRWEQACGGAGGAVIIQGAPGVGKTRLARELATSVAAAGGLVFRGVGEAGAAPMAVLRGMVERHVADLHRRPEPDREAAVRLLRTAAGDLSGVLGTLSSALGELLQAPELPPGDHERHLDEAVAALLVELARACGGALLFLDGMQWCDDRSRSVLRRLATQVSKVPILVVATVRDDAESSPATEAFVADLRSAADLRLTVGPLTEDAVTALVAGQLGAAAVPVELVNMVASRTAGNPLAVLEFVRAVVDAGLLRPSWGSWQLDHLALEALALPDNVVALVLRRVDGLGEQARQVLTAAAAVGTRFSGELVAAVTGVTPQAVHGICVEAAGHRLVEAATGGGFRFLHDRIREALLDNLDDETRRRLHRRIAATWERAAPEPVAGAGDPGRAPSTDVDRVYEVARHHLLGGVGDDPSLAFRAFSAAGVTALWQHAPADAFAYLIRARDVAVAAGLELDAGFHADLGMAATRIGDRDLALEHLWAARGIEPDPILRARLCNLISRAHLLRLETDEALEMIHQGMTELGRRLPRHRSGLIASVLVSLVWGKVLSLTPMRWSAATGDRAQRLRMQVELFSTGGEAAGIAQRTMLLVAFSILGTPVAYRLWPGPEYILNQGAQAFMAGMMGRRRRCERGMRRAIEMAEATGDHRLAARLHYFRAAVDDAIPALRATSGAQVQELLDAQERWLDFGLYLNCAGALELIYLLRGYTSATAELHRRVLARAPAETEILGHTLGVAGAELAALSGRPADAARQLEAVRAHLATIGDHPMVRDKVAIAALLLAVEQGDLGEAFERALADLDAIRISPTRSWSVDRICWVYRAFGRLEQAAQAASDRRTSMLVVARTEVRLLRRAANGPLVRAWHAVARASLIQLGGNPGRALRMLARQDGRAGGLDMPLMNYEVARVRARAYRELGRPADAAWQARIALLLATDHDWVNRARWVRAEFTVAAIRVEEVGSSHTTGQRLRSSAGTNHSTRGARTMSVRDRVEQRRLQAAQQVGLAAATVLDPLEVARLALDEVVAIFAAERAFLFVQENGKTVGSTLVPYIGRDESRADLVELAGYGSTLVDRVAETGEPLVVSGSEEGAALGSQSAVVHGLRSIMVAPVLLKGRLLGVIYLDSRAAKGVFTPDDVEILIAITNHVATSLETARAAQLELGINAARHERDLAQTLHVAMVDLGGSLDPHEVGRRLVDTLARTLPVDSAVLLRRIDRGPLTVVAATGAAAASLDTPIDPDCEVWLRTGEGLRSGADPMPATLLGCPTGGWLVVPLTTRAEEQGVIVAGQVDRRRYTEAEVEIASALVAQGATALDNALLFTRIEDLAVRDGLTGLFNRRHFFELAQQRVATTLRYGRPLAAIMIDIDYFKQVNDAHGHGVGDEVIREVASRLAGALRDSDVICRYGGEEFAVLLPETSAEQAQAAAERLHQVVGATAVSTAVGPLEVTVSLGLAAPEAENDVHALLKHADEALYIAKRSGRNQVATAPPDGS